MAFQSASRAGYPPFATHVAARTASEAVLCGVEAPKAHTMALSAARIAAEEVMKACCQSPGLAALQPAAVVGQKRAVQELEEPERKRPKCAPQPTAQETVAMMSRRWRLVAAIAFVIGKGEVLVKHGMFTTLLTQFMTIGTGQDVPQNAPLAALARSIDVALGPHTWGGMPPCLHHMVQEAKRILAQAVAALRAEEIRTSPGQQEAAAQSVALALAKPCP